MSVEEHWDKSDDDLFELLGVALLGSGLQLSPDDQDAYRRFGKRWFQRQFADLQRRICGHERVTGIADSGGSDRLIDAAAIYQVLSDFDEYAINAALLAVLVARVGLGTFCAGYWVDP